MQSLSHDDIAHLASLARLTVTEEEKERYATQLSSVVGYVEQLQQVETGDVFLGAGVTGMMNILAEDEPRQKGDGAELNPETVLAHAPLRSGRFIQVRAVLNGEGGAA